MLILANLKKAFSFHWSDLLGLTVGFVLVSNCSDAELFELVISFPLYLLVFLAIFLIDSWRWLLGYHGETAYLKSVFLGILKSYLRSMLAILSTFGVYFFIRAFF